VKKGKRQVARCELQVKIKIQNAKKDAGCRESASRGKIQDNSIDQSTN